MTVLARCADGEEAVTAVRNHQPDVALLDLEMPGIDGLTAAQQIAALTTDCPLTERELDALRLTREGLTVLEIATRLHLAHGTIRNYLSSGIAKTGQTRSQTRSQTRGGTGMAMTPLNADRWPAAAHEIPLDVGRNPLVSCRTRDPDESGSLDIL